MPKLPNNQQFPKELRLRRQADFDAVYQNGAFVADDVLVLKACRNQLGVTRLGLAVSRKVGNAVVRNRWKRLIREAFRTQRSELPVGMDFVIRPRKGAKCDHDTIRQSIKKLAQRVSKKL
ncbi:MAG: ribonuclease P protein component [Mariniblastus sp.]|nr:ribonuclease P protein component [Mariniblastus sp.]